MAMTTTVEKILAKANELEAQARALRLAARVLDGDVLATKQASLERTVAQASALRKTQTNGHAVEAEVGAVATRKAARLTLRQQEAREDKRTAILEIIREYGKPMPLAKLREAAAGQGITSLTGMHGYVVKGLLKKTGSKGKTRYALVPA